MAVIAGPIQTAYQTPDYTPVIEANRLAGMQQQQIMQGAVGQVTDYFKQQGEKKKLIKQSDVQIDAALKLFPDLAPTLQGVRDQIRDENVPLNDRAAIAESVAGLVNMGISTMRDQSNQILEQQKLRQNAEYQSQQLQIAQQNANSRAASAMAAGQQPPKTLEVPVEGGTQTMQWDANSGSYIPIQVSGLGGGSQVSADGSLVDIVKQFEGFNPRAYSDYGQTSIGYGTKGKPGEVLTEQQASQRLEAELAGHAKRIEEAAALKGITLNENQFKALTSFDYNTGKGTNLIGRFGDKPEQLAAKMLEYTKADGETLRGLEKRRQVEAALFLSPVEEQTVQQQPTVGFKPSETKAFRPATPEEAKPYGGGFGQIDTSTGQFYPISQSSDESESFRPATPDEVKAYGGAPGQVNIKTNRFYALPQAPRVDPRTRDLQMYEEARKAYLAGDDARAIDLLSTLRANGLFGGAVTITDLPERFGPREEPPATESPAPAPAATPSLDPERKAQIDAFFPNRQ
jgi:GH24 family phage-related lysozyme (muramidase)